jgi:hypothetical protein
MASSVDWVMSSKRFAWLEKAYPNHDYFRSAVKMKSGSDNGSTPIRDSDGGQTAWVSDHDA